MVASCTALAVLSLIAVHLHGLVLAVRALARRELPVFALVRGFLTRRSHRIPQAAVVRSERATLNLHARLPEARVRGRWRGVTYLLHQLPARVAHHDFLRLLVPRCRHVIDAQPVLALPAAQAGRRAVRGGEDPVAACTAHAAGNVRGAFPVLPLHTPNLVRLAVAGDDCELARGIELRAAHPHPAPASF